MAEKLTACKDCHLAESERLIARPYFDYWRGEQAWTTRGYGLDWCASQSTLCENINKDGHCPHFKEKEKSNA